MFPILQAPVATEVPYSLMLATKLYRARECKPRWLYPTIIAGLDTVPLVLRVSSLLHRTTVLLPLPVHTLPCIPPLAEPPRSYDGHPSTSHSLELASTLQLSAASDNPSFKVNPIRHRLSTTPLHSRDLLRQLSKERLVVRCSPISARQSFKSAHAATTHPSQRPKHHSSPRPAPLAPYTSRTQPAHP